MPAMAHRARASTAWWWYAAAAALTCAILLAGHRSQAENRRIVMQSFQTQQSLFALSVVNSLSEHLGEEEQDLRHAVREIKSAGGPAAAPTAIANLLASHSEDFLSIALFDAEGELLNAAPSVGLWGPELRGQMREALRKHVAAGRAFLTEPFVSPGGDTGIVLCVPFHAVAGGPTLVMAGALRMEDFMLRHFPSWHGRSIGFVLTDDDGEILSMLSTEHRTDRAMKLGNVFTPGEQCLGCHAAADFADIAAALDRRGVGHSIFRAPGGAAVNRTTLAFRPYNERWILSLVTPFESVQLQIDRSRRIDLALTLALAAVLGGLGWMGGVRARLRAAEERTAQLRESEERFRAVFESANDGIIILDAAGTIRDVNRTLHERLGYAREELVGRSVAVLDDPAGAALVPQRMAAIMRERAAVFPVEHFRKDGTRLTEEVSARVFELGGQPVVVSVVRDVTERAAADRELRRYAREIEEANRLKDLFNDMVRHDLLNLLSVARGYAELLPEPADPAGRDLVSSLRRSLGRLAELIRSAAHLASLMETEELETAGQDLGAVLAESVQPFAAELASGGWELAMPPEVPRPIRASPVLVEVFTNLVGNAMKFGGERRRVEVTARDGGEDWIVAVRDWGPGISPTERERAFRRFERLGVRGAKGMGLGLAIAKRIVDLHGGSIRIEENPEGGCIFVVRLPKAGPAAPAAGRKGGEEA